MWDSVEIVCAYQYACFWATQMLKGPHIGGKAERAGAAQPGEEKAQEDLINVYKYKGTKRTKPGSFQWCPVTGPEAMGTN